MFGGQAVGSFLPTYSPACHDGPGGTKGNAAAFQGERGTTVVAAPNEGTPEKHGRTIYLSQPVRERRRCLSPAYVLISLYISPARAREAGRST